MLRSAGHETLDAMRVLLLLILVVTSCTTQRNAATSPTPSPTLATPTPTATNAPTASPSPIALPSFAQLSAPSGTVVWALVGGTRLFRSSDRGDTWEERTLPSPVINPDIAFMNDKDGLVLSAGSAATQCQVQSVSIWKTSDGAGTWQQIPHSGIADAMCKRFLSSADSTHAYFTTYSPNAGSLIYRTADAGAGWTASAPLPIPPSLASHGGLFASITERPRAFGSVVLVGGGGGQTKVVFRSTDGGATFTNASTVEASGSVAYVTATRWLQMAPSIPWMETSDGGATWHDYTTDYTQAAPIAPDVVFGDASVGYATVRGAIQRTTDGGAHWTAIKTPGTG
jgi:photosystem II stability/assembly factor-like uncharacterized protein